MFDKLFGKSKKKDKEPQKPDKPEKQKAISRNKETSSKISTGTVLRTDSPKETQEKPKTVLEIAEEQDWEVKEVPVYEVGDVIDGEYEVEKVFSGGMGHVYIAHSQQQQLRFAIKQPNEMMLSNKSFFARVLREADAWTDLGMHPHIAYCYFVKKIDGVPYIFIEYVDGGNLREWIAEGKCADFKAGIEMAIQFCHGMERAHQKGMMHRDIKPENVLMTKDGKVKVTDFGLAGVVEKGEGQAGAATGGGSLTRLGDVMGTETYMSPEQWEDPHNVGPQSDVFSFGVCMWEMFCGRRPYQVAVGEVEAPPEPHSLRTDIPEELSKILQKAIDLEKDKRPKDFAQLREELNAVHKELSGEEAANFQIKIPDTLADELCNRGYSYIQLGDNNRALESWEKALQADPHHIESTYNRGLLLWRSGRMTDDILVHQLEEVRTTHTGDWRDEYCLALVHTERGDAESAIKVLEEASRVAPEESEIKRALTVAHSGQGKWHSYQRTFEGHKDSVYSASISPDGHWGLSGSSDSTLRLWELTTGRCVWTFEGHTGKVNSVCISPDGRWALSGSEDKALRLWELSTGKCIRTFEGHLGRVNSVCISPDGRWCLSGSYDKTLRLWKLSTGKCIRTFEGNTGIVDPVSISPDGRWALSGCWDFTLRLWDLATGRCVRTFEGHNKSVKSVNISPDGRLGLSGSYDKTLRLWDLATGRCMRTFEGHTGSVYSVSISPDGRWAFSGSSDNTLRLWDLATGRCVRTFEGHSKTVNSVSISPDGRWVLTGSWDNTLRLWKVGGVGTSGSFIISLPRSTAEIDEFAGIVGAALKKARLALEQSYPSDAAASVNKARQTPGYEKDSELLKLWHTIGLHGKCINFKEAWCKRTFEGHMGNVNSVSISPDGRWGLSGSSDKTLRLWDLATGRCVRTFEGHTNAVYCVSINPDGRWALSGSLDKTLRLWELATGKCMRTFEGYTSVVHSVSISPDGRWGLSGSLDETLRLWELAMGKCVRTFEGHTDSVSSVSISPDGYWGLSGSYKTLCMWELATGECVRIFEGRMLGVTSVNISPDGRWGLSGNWDETLRLWELSTGRCVRTFEGHTGKVNSVCISSDGRWGLSGSEDKTMRLWELSTGRCVRIFEGHERLVKSVCISPDGRWALSGSEDKTLRLWELVWDYEFPDPVDWDEEVKPYAENFLTLYDNKWTDEQFDQFYQKLQYAGLGWVHKEGVLRKLKEMAGRKK